MIAPVMIDHGDDYEREKLQKKLKDGSLTLERTEQWLRKAVQAVREVQPTEKIELFCEDLRNGQGYAYVEIHDYAMVDLVIMPSFIFYWLSFNCLGKLHFLLVKLQLFGQASFFLG